VTKSNLFLQSQVFVALCAAALTAETFIVAGTPFNFVIISVVFFASFFIYNASRLYISIWNKSGPSKFSLRVDGSSLSIFICIVCIIFLFGLLTACNWKQLLVFMGTAFLSIIYMMPFKKNGIQLHGLRNDLFLKNIILSVTWALSTVIFPLLNGSNNIPDEEIIFMFIRRFFFIYALTVIYDLRDLEADKYAGMETIALKFGNRNTRLWAFAALLIFSVLVLFDPFLRNDEMRPLSTALLLSAFAGALLIRFTKSIHHKPYFPVIVDSAMAIQFFLVLLFHQS